MSKTIMNIAQWSEPDPHSTLQPCNSRLHPIYDLDRTTLLVSQLLHAHFSDKLGEPCQTGTAETYDADIALPHQPPRRLHYASLHLNSRTV